ncbi:MAG: hypothetical protein LQ351_004567 [Letrouitia transgressa]|nr:MAG: hypothetical protein LQ351_004567 [Letrouitia transgressa]
MASSGHSKGADILATSNDHKKYQVFVPDFLFGKYADHAWVPPDTPEKGAKMGEFFAGPGNPSTTVGNIGPCVKSINDQTGGKITKWAALGMCWGGKIVSFVSGTGTPFAVAAEVHPAMVDPADAANITIPLAMLASGDEDAGAVAKFGEALKVEKHIETFQDQVHVCSTILIPKPLP